MKYFPFFVTLVYFISASFVLVQGWIGVENFDPTRNTSSHCFGEMYGIGPMEKGESKRVKDICAQAECLEDRSIKIAGCAPMAIKPPCYLTEGELSKPFPECCYEKHCPSDNKV